MSAVEIQGYIHINFKTCKTILCISCIYFFKSTEIINTQNRWELGGGKEREGRPRHGASGLFPKFDFLIWQWVCGC